jgi:PAS domain S-box-containing protein
MASIRAQHISTSEPGAISPDTDAQNAGGDAVDLLLRAGLVLASSLDLATTMRRNAALMVPRLADLCVIDLLNESGAIEDVAVACSREPIARALERLRRSAPLDPEGSHPVARVIRGGEPLLLREMSESALRSFAQDSTHASFMIEHGYRSAIVAPLTARSRTLGALSTLRLGESKRYDRDDLELVCELARRSALAIDNARLYSDLQRAEQRLEAVLGNLAEAITVVDADGRTVFANQAAAKLLKASSPRELIESPPGTIMPRFLVFDEHGARLGLSDMPGRRLFAGEHAEPLLVRNVVRATGEERWLVVRSSAIVDRTTGQVAYVANVFENITGVKRVQLAESFMAEASRVLASSLDYGETLARVARLAVPQIASWCAVDLLNTDGEIERVAVHHPDPAMVELAQRINRDYHQQLDDQGGVAEVIRTGRSQFFDDLSPDTLAAYARDEEHLKVLRAIDASAVIIVPMIGAAGTIGAITLVSSGDARKLDAADVPLAERLARRSGTAVEHARLYTERTRIAHALQEALLPRSLPEIPGVQLHACYSAAGELNEVGGDFYDVIDRGEDRWMLAIGDVCGKGPRAAGVTALARHTLRAAAMSGSSATEMLELLHQALLPQPDGADLCTVCLVTVDLDPQDAGDGPSHAEIGVALAGHPPPLLIHPDGEVTQLGRPGTLLGVLDSIDVTESRAEIGAGETLLLYTDGVIEAGPQRARLGEEGLIDLCSRLAHRPLAQMLDNIERAATERVESGRGDDLAMLGMRLAAGDLSRAAERR